MAKNKQGNTRLEDTASQKRYSHTQIRLHIYRMLLGSEIMFMKSCPSDTNLDSSGTNSDPSQTFSPKFHMGTNAPLDATLVKCNATLVKFIEDKFGIDDCLESPNS